MVCLLLGAYRLDRKKGPTPQLYFLTVTLDRAAEEVFAVML